MCAYMYLYLRVASWMADWKTEWGLSSSLHLKSDHYVFNTISCVSAKTQPNANAQISTCPYKIVPSISQSQLHYTKLHIIPPERWTTDISSKFMQRHSLPRPYTSFVYMYECGYALQHSAYHRSHCLSEDLLLAPSAIAIHNSSGVSLPCWCQQLP